MDTDDETHKPEPPAWQVEAMAAMAAMTERLRAKHPKLNLGGISLSERRFCLTIREPDYPCVFGRTLDQIESGLDEFASARARLAECELRAAASAAGFELVRRKEVA